MICYLENQIWFSFFWGVVVVQWLSHVQVFPTPWTAARQASQSFTSLRARSNSYLLSHWGHSTILSSVIPFSSSLQSFPASGSFLMSQFFTSGGHSIGASASASILPMNIQGWFPLEWYHLHMWGCWYFSQQSWFELVSHPAQYFMWYTLHRS